MAICPRLDQIRKAIVNTASDKSPRERANDERHGEDGLTGAVPQTELATSGSSGPIRARRGLARRRVSLTGRERDE